MGRVVSREDSRSWVLTAHTRTTSCGIQPSTRRVVRPGSLALQRSGHDGDDVHGTWILVDEAAGSHWCETRFLNLNYEDRSDWVGSR
jgi:hypothetical protein